MADILVTGFGPFPGVARNPSALIAARLAHARLPGVPQRRIAAAVFPTSYAAVDRLLPALLATHRPRVLLLLGVAARSRALRIETLARNTTSPVYPDVDGTIPDRRTINPDEPNVLRGAAPFARLLAAARRARIPARLSRDAGTYLCNYAYWRALEYARAAGGPRRVVFVHVPNPATCHSDGAALARMTRALGAILRVLAADNLR